MKSAKEITVFVLILVVFIMLIKLSDNEQNHFSDAAEEIMSIEQADEEARLTDLRRVMVETQLKSRDIYNPAVLEVMRKVPRHEFMTLFLSKAYNDRAVPIEHGQTISQPYIVALMTQSLDLKSSYKVLEIGTGSGYQAAVLAEIVDEVHTIEIIKPLSQSANATLKRLGYDNVNVYHADGYFGLEEEAPFDAIIVTAAANHVPPPLLEQLKIGSYLIIPLASPVGYQVLTLITKLGEENMTVEYITGVRFVPMTGEALKDE